MKLRGGEFSTGTMGNFQPELTSVDIIPDVSLQLSARSATAKVVLFGIPI